MFELSGVNYEEVLEQGDSILVRVIGSSSYRGFELSGLYCSCLQVIAGINNNEIMKGIDKNYHLYFEPVLGATFYIQRHVFIYNINNNNQNRRVISFLFRPAMASCMIIKQQPVHILRDVGLI